MLKKISLSIIIISIILIILGTATFLYIYWPRTVELFGVTIPNDISILDLTDCPIDTSKEWIYKLNDFKNLKIVKCDNNTIPREEKYDLETSFPHIHFDIITTINIYGLDVREDEKYIDLSSAIIDNTTLVSSLKEFPKLEKVNLLNQTLNPELQIDLLKEFPTISFVWNVQIADQLVENNIENLELKNSKITDLDLFETSLKLLPNLKYLNMSGCNLSNEELGALREHFPNIKIVWTIHLGKWSLQTDAVAFSVLITKFDYVRMKSEDIEVLKYCTDLQALDLGHQAITDISIIGDYLPNLRILILADNKITDISPLSKLKHLHYLELFINRIRDLSPLIECKELVDLNLCYNTALDLSPLINNDFPVLERLWLVGCNISTKNYNLLKNKYPLATIVNSGAGSTNSGWRTHARYYAMINMFYKKNYISELFTKYDK